MSPEGNASGRCPPANSGVYLINWRSFAKCPRRESPARAPRANPERKPHGRGEMRRKRLILSPPLRFSLSLSFLIPPLSCAAFQQSVKER